MRIVQIIDSLEMGGAERMAVNYANMLSEKIPFSGLVASRKEGNLKFQLDGKVDYLFLDKKHTIDTKALSNLKAYCKKNKIDIIHAHGTSFFIAVLLKLTYPRIKVVWHDHYGLSEYLSSRKSAVLKLASYFFSGIISVNNLLKQWAHDKLHCKKVVYLANFAIHKPEPKQGTCLNGISGKRILCLANLREQKNHLMLINVAEELKSVYPDWTFHFVGKDFGDSYSKDLEAFIVKKELSNNVFLYGTRDDIGNIIDQAEIAVLASKSEGLPVALLEYGMNKKAVIVTNVGEIPSIIINRVNGLLVQSENQQDFLRAILDLIENPPQRVALGEALYNHVSENNSGQAIISHYLQWLKQL